MLIAPGSGQSAHPLKMCDYFESSSGPRLGGLIDDLCAPWCELDVRMSFDSASTCVTFDLLAGGAKVAC